MEVNGQLLESCADAAELLQPSDALLDDRSTAVSKAVEPDRRIVPGVFVFFVRNDGNDFLSAQPVADALDAVALVAGQLAGLVTTLAEFAPASDQGCDRLADDRFGTRRFVDFAGGDFDGKWSARTVSDNMELRSKPASAAAQCVIRGFVGMTLETFLSAPAAARAARTEEPSTHHSSQSMYPLLSSLTCNASTMSAKTPLLRHLRKWSYTVCQGPYRSGRSRQGAPVPRIQKMPLRFNRGSLAGRPVRAVLIGMKGETDDHWSSSRSCRCIRAKLHPASKPDKQYDQHRKRFSDRA
jgi:hypothetical protein